MPGVREQDLWAMFFEDTWRPAEAVQLKLPLVTKTGEEMQNVVADNFDLSDEALAKIRELSKP